MANYSATEAISPAIERTRRFLLEPFRWGRLLKLTLVAALTEGGASSCNFSSRFPSGQGAGHSAPSHLPHWNMPSMVGLAAGVAILLLVLLIGLLISYLVIRLRFVFFDCVLRGRDRIGEGWGLYHRQAMRYFGLSILIGVGFLIVLGSIGLGVWLQYRGVFASIGTDQFPGFGAFLPLILLAIPVILVLAVAGSMVETLLSHLMLPHLALEDAKIGDAFSDAWQDIMTEPAEFTVFWLMKGLVALAGSIIAMIALVFASLVLGLIGLVIGLLLKLASTVLMWLFAVPAIVLAGGLLVVACIVIGGAIGTFRRNYSVLFYAGRFPQMAEILWPAPPMPPELTETPPQPDPQLG